MRTAIPLTLSLTLSLALLLALAAPAGAGDPIVAPVNPPGTGLTVLPRTFNLATALGGFTLNLPSQIVIGDQLIVQLRPAADLADILPPLLWAKLIFRLKTPRGEKTFGPFDLAMDGAGGISYQSFEDCFAEYSVTDLGDYKVTASLIARDRITQEEYKIDLPEKRITATGSGGDGDATDEDGPPGEPGAPDADPLETEFAKITLQAYRDDDPQKKALPFVEEDVPCVFVADMSKVKFASPVTVNAAKQTVIDRYFDPDKLSPSGCGKVPAGPEEIGGGVEAVNFVYRWSATAPDGSIIPGTMSNPALAPVVPPPGGPVPPPPAPAPVAAVPEFRLAFAHPTEPKRCRVEFTGSFTVIRYVITYDQGGCASIAAELAKIEDEFENVFKKNLKKEEEEIVPGDKAKVGVRITDSGQWPNPVTFYGNAYIAYTSEKTEEINADIKPIEIVKDLGGTPRKVVTRKLRWFVLNYGKQQCVGTFTCPTERKQNQVARMTFPVYDTTAPEIEFVVEEGGLSSHGDYKVTTGDMKLIRVRVKDNNRFARVRTPYLYYETEPSAGRKENWCGAPLRMETIDGVSSPPFLGAEGNNFRWQAFAPVPVNYIGQQCVKWYVDAFDGSNHPRFSAAESAGGTRRPGNRNRGKMNYAVQPGEWEVTSTDVGTFSLYDNDRPNILAKVYEVVDGKPRLIVEYAATEDWRTPDFYGAVNVSSPNFSGLIPDDAILASAGFLPPQSDGIFTYFMDRNPELKTRILRGEPRQVEDAAGMRFHYKTADSGPQVIFEDKQYLFAFDLTDNVDFAASGNGIERRENMEKFERLRWQLYDPEAERRMEALSELSFGPDGGGNAQGWYLGPRDPEVDAIGSKREIPMFEHIFHAPKGERADGPPPYLRFAATDRQGHTRFIKLTFQVVDVKTEFRNLEGKVERSRQREVKK